eukprot:TRINITY_DN45511_c0_g1_i1.p1 TRINITY_DN45511_c0_g1~~TRINITY_DN45511_c0_g1_i1.p1  ORF type:complete len:551 (-),score=116.38 TRINITY_DN45511_c0_g1_i1:86-1738(-)
MRRGSTAGYGDGGEHSGRDLTATEISRHIQELHGKTNQIRTQLTELHKKYLKIPQVDAGIQFDHIQRDLAQLKAAQAQAQSDTQQVAALRSEVAQTRSEVAQQTAQLRNEMGQLRNELVSVARLKDDISQARSQLGKLGNLESSLEQIMRNNDTSAMKQEVDRFRNEVESQKRASEQEVQRLKQELTRTKDEIQGTSRKQQETMQNLEEVKRKGLAKPGLEQDVGRLKSEMGMTATEFRTTAVDFRNLERRLNELGVLKPPKIELPEDAPRPVGTVCMAEDCYTARLLVKLAYMKQAAESFMRTRTLEHEDCDESSGSDSDANSQAALMDDNVAGLMPPEIQDGAPGFWAATKGWSAICTVTLLMQLLIVTILWHYSLTPTECFDYRPSQKEYMVLHVSKAAAVIVAGGLMAKDFMDIVNGLMVSVLMEPHLSFEVLFTTLCRLILYLLIGITNVRMFQGMVHPSSVWINMAALAFVGELGSAMNELGKAGTFGHAIRSCLTNINYELTFMSEYPWWIPIVQKLTLFLTALFTIFNALSAYNAEDTMCLS